MAHSFSRKDLAGVFSSPRDAFENASIGVDLPNRFFQNERSGMTLRQSDFRSIRYDGTAIILTGKTEKPRHLPYLHRKSLFPEFPFEPFILPAERLSIPLFYKELDFTKNQLIDFIQKMSAAKYRDGFSLFSVIDKTTSRYALPIKTTLIIPET